MRAPGGLTGACGAFYSEGFPFNSLSHVSQGRTTSGLCLSLRRNSAASMMSFMALSLFLAVEGFGQGGGNPEGLPLILTLLPFVTKVRI